VPAKARMLSVMVGIFIVFVCVALLINLAWGRELDELLFGFISMYVILAIILMRVGVVNASGSDQVNLNGDRNLGSGDRIGGDSDQGQKS